MVYTYIKNKFAEYQNNPNLKKHIIVNFTLIALTLILVWVFQIEELQEDKNLNQVQSEDSLFQNFLKILDYLLDYLLYFLLFLEIIALMVQIKFIISDKEKQENPLTLPILQSLSEKSFKSSNYAFQSVNQGKNEMEMQDIQKLKTQETKSIPIPPNQELIENPEQKTSQEAAQSNTKLNSSNSIPKIPLLPDFQTSQINQVLPAPYSVTENQLKQIENSDNVKSEQIIYSKLLGRAQQLKNGNYVNIYIIQKCEKQSTCNFFWISQKKSTDYICLNCDQENKILGKIVQFNKENNQQNKQNQPIQFLLSNKFENQLLEICKIYKDELKFCYNFEICGFFWFQNSLDLDDQYQYYCPICMHIYQIEHQQKYSNFKVVTSKCSYCKQVASEYFQPNCFHPYHFECLKEIAQIKNQTKILCVFCNVNITNCLKQNKLLTKEDFEKILSNQIQIIKQGYMHEGIEDLE
ncbi:unnamed protein product [Paramecium sonneborni]|uniref:RING-type domain-containing protein n=1 Tax=Paramecium sonneborni TaxID=65129 RepID=A0A8S1KII8_9CILI|nr:unnamed protein product [Paramecium sonneborni]